jgi:non-ribosomal peptide synthetase component E (peptide arylation enzyme)
MTPIDFFWRAAQRWPARTAIQSPQRALSFAELAGRVAALAAA